MQIGIGIGACFLGNAFGAVQSVLMLDPEQWPITERAEDAYTRQLQIDIPVNPPTGRKYIWYRGPHGDGRPTSGNFGSFVSMGGTAWRAQAAGPSPLDGFDYVRVFTVPTTEADPVAWNNALVGDCVPDAEIKRFYPSNTPAAPSVTYVTVSPGVARFTFVDINSRGRTVTGGKWRVGAGVLTAFSGTGPLDVSGFTDGTPIAFEVLLTNVNGDSALTSGVVTTNPPPPAAAVTFDSGLTTFDRNNLTFDRVS